MNEFTKNRLNEIKNLNENPKRRYKSYKEIYDSLNYFQRRVLEELAKKSKNNEIDYLKWIEEYNAIDFNTEIQLSVEMVDLERQRLIEKIPEEKLFQEKNNLLSKIEEL